MAPRDAKQPSVAQGDALTTNQGIKIEDDANSLKAGSRGPTLLEDFHFREKMTHFDHERMPERVVHPRGSGAHGYFQVYKSLSKYTKAAVLTDTSAKTPVFVRFSVVNGNLGTADTIRDARGFATKFYTSEGVWDLVGNNIPVFFIQDAIKFPDLVHAFKPEPHNDIPQGSTAHNSFWDFISLTPESMHMIMWIMSDRAIPRSYRMMEGFGVHTFRLVNDQGKSTFVKFHWKPELGVHSLVWDEAQKLAGKDPDFHRRDLWEAIENKAYPEYELALQLVPEDEADKIGVDVLDPTKIWPEDKVPVQRVGKLTLNRNPDNFFAETEEVAFHPGHLVPGIDVSDDPLLQGRLFSYLDTQLNRFGTPNFTQLPINQPKSPVNNFQQDGPMRFTNRPGKANYEPNSLKSTPDEAEATKGGYVHYPSTVQGTKIKERSKTFGDHYTQAALFYNSLTLPEQDHIGQALTFELSKVSEAKIKSLMLDHLAKVDEALATKVAAKLGLQSPKGQPAARAGKAKGLSQEEPPTGTIKSRKVAILASDGVVTSDITRLEASLKKEGATAEIIAPHMGQLKDLKIDKSFVTADSIMYDAVYIPSGKESVSALMNDYESRHFVREAYDHGKAIAASGDAKELLQAVGVSSAAAGVVIDKDANDLSKAFVEAMSHHRHWNRPK
ncbi:catalase [Nitrospira sp. KM1]|uniref:catalase n=1 Tax=Nitrospira sp. KM1 TaxID=1936990 RepID=UPI0018D98B06|nr:catalase [Nitrospira sp. KM1]